MDATNVVVNRQGNAFHILMDSSAVGTPSKSGRSDVKASTHGWMKLDETHYLSLNLICKRPKAGKAKAKATETDLSAIVAAAVEQALAGMVKPTRKPRKAVQ